jgi:hypothetical protein
MFHILSNTDLESDSEKYRKNKFWYIHLTSTLQMDMNTNMCITIDTKGGKRVNHKCRRFIVSLFVGCWKCGCRCFTIDSLPWGTRDSCSGFGVNWTRRLTQETVDLYRFGLSWSSNSLYIPSVLAFVLDWLLWSSITGVPTTSLYIGRDSYGAITILIGSKECVMF